MKELRNKIGSIDIDEDGCGDNLAIALSSYFENLPECPTDDINDEVGWSQWAMDRTNGVLDKIADLLEVEGK